MSGNRLLSKKDLCNRWEISFSTLEKYIANGVVKPLEGANAFPMKYIEAIEMTNVDLETANAFTLRAKDRRIEQLEKRVAELESNMLQVAMIANDGVRGIIGKVV